MCVHTVSASGVCTYCICIRCVYILYLHQVCVRVMKGDRYSEWSSKFSLKTLGSEGVFSCPFKDSSEVLQVCVGASSRFVFKRGLNSKYTSYFIDWDQS